MQDSEFSELRSYADAADQCIDMGYRPSESLIRQGWLREIVRGCWQITPSGSQAFAAVLTGSSELKPDQES